jgi:hypothetical protein
VILDIPNGALDPAGYRTAEITLREPTGDTVRAVAIAPGGGFDLGEMAPKAEVAIEAILRNDSGTAVGYGRTAGPVALTAGAAVVVPIRRPIVYIAGVNYTGSPPNWFGVPSTYSDLSVGGALSATTRAGQRPVLMVSAGPALYAIDQGVVGATGALVGDATVRPLAAADHALGAPLRGALSGAAQDGAGSDDGSLLAIGTSTALYVVDARPESAAPVRAVAQGNFSRVAVVSQPGGALAAVAIKNRITTTGAPCAATAELWWVGDLGGEATARMLAVGGFTDVAADAGRAWYLDGCKGELGEITGEGPRRQRGDLGRATAIAVSSGQAWIGVERAMPTVLAVVVTPLTSVGGPVRLLWSEVQEQILAAERFPGVQRRMPAQSAVFRHLEVGAGGELIAAGTAGAYYGAEVPEANFPEMDIETEELRVFDAGTGGVIQRYRSWCDGAYFVIATDIQDWICASTAGQTAAADGTLEQRIQSMTFAFGKK